MNEAIQLIQDFPSELYSLFLENPLAQGIGFLAFGMSILTFLSGNDNAFMKRMTLSSVFWAFHFLLLGALSAGLLNVVDFFKNIFAIAYPMNKKIACGVVFVYICIGAWLYVIFEQWTDLLPVIASIASTVIIFTLKGIWMRIAFQVSILSWVVYNYHMQSIGGLSTDIVLFVTGTIGIWKMYTEETIKNG